jgi:uncharacterized membrane protein YdcZ (DUF606 family)
VIEVNPDIELVNAPVPVPSVVLLLAVVGLVAMFQQIPRAVTDAPPSFVIFPPLLAVVVVIKVIAVVDRVGTTDVTALVVKLISLP